MHAPPNSVSLVWMLPLFAVLMSGCGMKKRGFVLASPNEEVSLELALRQTEVVTDQPQYRVRWKDTDVVKWSGLGMELAEGSSLGGPCEITGIERRPIHEEYVQFPGKRRFVVADGNEATIHLRETTPPNRQWNLVLRAYNDGAAFRYEFPAQNGWSELTLVEEKTQFAIPSGSLAYALPLNGFQSAYEGLYKVQKIEEMDPQWLLGLPLLYEVPNGGWAAITEAALTDYAGLYLAPDAAAVGLLTARLSPLPDESGIAARARLPHASPWRTILVGDSAGKLAESDLILNLNKPNTIGDTSWIKPGKTTFPWWNGYYLQDVDFEPGLNNATMRHYIDFCAENGIPYHTLDGVRGTAWYGGKIVPYEGADITTGIPGLDLEEVIRYAKSKGVRIRLWMNWAAARAQMERAFPLYSEWGVEGVMLDFMNRDDQEMNQFLEKAVKLAAEYHLTVTLHGVAKPTGLERTYPNLLNHEAVRNLEYNKFTEDGCTPRHQVIVPYTRMLAGPLDFHEGSFRAVPQEEYAPRDVAPVVIGTPTRNLAMYVAYQNHLPMLCDYPSAYRGHPAFPALVQIPDSWDETRFVSGQVGEFFAVARRSGNIWHVGILNGEEAREVRVPLEFLGPGTYGAELWIDNADSPYGVTLREQQVTADQALDVKCDPGGATYVRFLPSHASQTFPRR